MFGKVIINNSGSSTNREYTYIIPDELINKAKTGSRVMVPFGTNNKELEGFLIAIEEKCQLDNRKLKKIKQVIDDSPLLSSDLISLIYYIRDNYICDYMDAIKAMVPPEIRLKSSRTVKLDVSLDHMDQNVKLKEIEWNILETINDNGNEIDYNHLMEIYPNSIIKHINNLKTHRIISVVTTTSKAVKHKYAKYVSLNGDNLRELNSRAQSQRKVIEYLLENGTTEYSELIDKIGCSTQTITSLEKKGYVSILAKQEDRTPRYGEYTEKIKFVNSLTKEQIKAVKEIIQSISHQKHEKFLLKGVTGSGKTEVYMTVIEEALRLGKDSIVLVPEISLTPQTVDRFVKRFGEKVAVLHSRLSQGERHDQWTRVAQGSVKIVVGARSAIFAPFVNLGVVIIDEEHEGTYKSESKPKYSTVEVAAKRCQLTNGVLILGTATPSIETYYDALRGEYKLINMDKRANNTPLPEVDIVDMRDELAKGNRTIFSRHLITLLRENLEAGNQSILFINRRGFANFVSCRDCGVVIKCKHCDISLTYHRDNNNLVCHYCGYKQINPETCPSCGSSNIRQFGLGTQRVEKEVNQLFPGAKTVRMDADTTSTKDAHYKILGDFSQGKYEILIGTQMISKGLDFPNVTLVGVISGDISLNLPDFRASERTFQLLTQVAGRSGRSEKKGRVVIQTYQPDHYAIHYSKYHDYQGFYSYEITLRKEFGYPPFIHLANIIISGRHEGEVIKTSNQIYDICKKNENLGLDIFGPTPAILQKIKGQYRWQIILKNQDPEFLRQMLWKLDFEIKSSTFSNSVRVSLGINPLNLL